MRYDQFGGRLKQSSPHHGQLVTTWFQVRSRFGHQSPTSIRLHMDLAPWPPKPKIECYDFGSVQVGLYILRRLMHSFCYKIFCLVTGGVDQHSWWTRSSFCFLGRPASRFSPALTFGSDILRNRRMCILKNNLYLLEDEVEVGLFSEVASWAVLLISD